MLRAVSVSLTYDLRPVILVLRNQGVALRVSEESGEQVVWVSDESSAALVQEALRALDRGDLKGVTEQLTARRPRLGNTLLETAWRLGRFLRTCPLTTVLAAACCVVALMTSLGRDISNVTALFFPPVAADSLLGVIGLLSTPMLVLRSFTPALLHFGELHLVFNLLWLFYFGRLLESRQSLGLVALVFFATAVGGNVAQYTLSGSNAFGGLSGLVYGLVGYTWALGVIAPSAGVQLRTATFFVFVVALVGMALFASGSIASGAHAGGLVIGLLLGALVGSGRRLLLSTPSTD